MTDLYHGPYPVDMTVNEAREEVRRLLQTATPYVPPDTLARLQRERDQAVEALREIAELDGEINPSNYDHDDACYLNTQFCYTATIARATLAAIEGAEDEG